MLKNYLLIALRVFRKHKLYTLINIGGLTVGLATAILIFLWVKHEYSTDQFHANGASLYSIIQEHPDNRGLLVCSNHTPGPMGPALKEEIPEIAQVSRLTYGQELAFVNANQQEGMERGIFADPEFFKMFSFPLSAGSDKIDSHDPNQIILSQSTAIKYFNEKSVIGQVITVSDGFNSFDLQVSGILEEIPANSSLKFDFVIPFEKFLQNNEWAREWGSSNFRTVVQLHPKASLEDVNQKIEPFYQEHHQVNQSNLFLQLYSDGYLYGNIKPGRIPAGRITYVRLFTFVGIFVLLIACINFMNLATARAGIRTREIGVRKVIGAYRGSLVMQFMTEALLLAATSMLCALILAKLLVPFFNQLTGKILTIPWQSIQFVTWILVLTVLTGLLSGSYPALFLSAFKPISTLKGQLTKNYREAIFRKALVVFQFTLSVTLVAATLVIYYQIYFIKNKNLGMDREQVLFVNVSSKIIDSQETFSNELKRLPGIKQVTFTSHRPSYVFGHTSDPNWEGMKEDERLAFRFLFSGHDFIKTMDMELAMGRDFSREITLDTLNYVLNETAVKMMNIEEPLGKTFDFWGRKGEIIGVVKDFHYNSMHQKIDPFVILLWPENTSNVMVKAEPGMTQEAIASLKTTYEKFVSDYPFEYSFLDDDFERVYRSELRIGRLANYFTAVVIFISCLGLFGLVSFTSERRTKEIGIRKVLGASVNQVLGLISKEFLPLVLSALVVATPIAWFLMKHWLQGFYYRISLEPWIFAMAGAAAIIIAMTAVSYQAIKAALANPVDALRNE